MADAKSRKKKHAANKSANDKKQTSANSDKSTDSLPTDWAQTVLDQLVEAQRSWFENASQQNAMLLETVNKLSDMRQKAPTEALSEWAKQGIENFVEAQKRWSEIAVRQSEQILQTVRSNAEFFGSNQTSNEKSSNQGIESLAKMRSAWLDFITSQNTQLVNSMKDTLKIDNSSPVAILADFARQAVNNYVEVQKRWLDLAIKFPLAGGLEENKK